MTERLDTWKITTRATRATRVDASDTTTYRAQFRGHHSTPIIHSLALFVFFSRRSQTISATVASTVRPCFIFNPRSAPSSCALRDSTTSRSRLLSAFKSFFSTHARHCDGVKNGFLMCSSRVGGAHAHTGADKISRAENEVRESKIVRHQLASLAQVDPVAQTEELVVVLVHEPVRDAAFDVPGVCGAAALQRRRARDGREIHLETLSVVLWRALASGLHRGPLVQELRDEEVGHRVEGRRRADAPVRVEDVRRGVPGLSAREKYRVSQK